MNPPAIDRLNEALGDRCRIERELGEGGMAVVYLAEDRKHRRLVALKVLRPELAAAIGAERFLREIETTANLRHPHILPLYDSGGSCSPSSPKPRRARPRRMGRSGCAGSSSSTGSSSFGS